MEKVGRSESRAVGHMILALPLLAAICLLLAAVLPDVVEKGGQEIARIEAELWAWAVGAAGTR